MRVTLLSTLSPDLTRPWVEHALRSRGHGVDVVDRPGLDPADAAPLGYRVADSWSTPPDVLLALDWVAGLAAVLAARERATPLVVRLPRPGRSGDPAVTRVERAVALDSTLTLAVGPSDLEALVSIGVPRHRLQVLAEAVDVRRHAGLAAGGASGDQGTPGEARPTVVAAQDDSPRDLHRVLRGMAAGQPAVVAEVGVLPDVVADTVTGLVVAPNEVPAAARALSRDPLRREAFGMAAADRVAACFDVDVVASQLERLLHMALDQAPALA